jgi:hypothetical protein
LRLPLKDRAPNDSAVAWQLEGPSQRDIRNTTQAMETFAMRRYRFLDERKFRHFCEGLTLGAKDMEVLDSTLSTLDLQTKLPSKIIQSNAELGFGGVYRHHGPSIVVSTTQLANRNGGGPVSITKVMQDKGRHNIPPALHIDLFSPVVQIPQRVEIPLRLVLKGLPNIESTHSVYLHALTMDSGEDYVYYGITKRGWMRRFNEHTKLAVAGQSPLKFHRIMGASIASRMKSLYPGTATDQGGEIQGLCIASMHHVICMAGVDLETAQNIEEYLVAKYSFDKPLGLNMIPGGRAGVSCLHQLSVVKPEVHTLSEEDRDHAICRYLETHPRLGIPNPAIARCWDDPEYAKRIICGRDGRLSLEQLEEIRRLGAFGAEPARITELVGARNTPQVERVLAGKTYRRIVSGNSALEGEVLRRERGSDSGE